MSNRCGGAVEAMGGRVPGGDDPPPGLEVTMGSETLRKEPFGVLEFSTLGVVSLMLGILLGGEGCANLEFISFGRLSRGVSSGL